LEVQRAGRSIAGGEDEDGTGGRAVFDPDISKVTLRI
jgi:hypothetical protein